MRKIILRFYGAVARIHQRFSAIIIKQLSRCQRLRLYDECRASSVIPQKNKEHRFVVSPSIFFRRLLSRRRQKSGVTTAELLRWKRF